MLGFVTLGSATLGAVPDDVIDQIAQSTSKVALSVSTLIIPDSHLLIADKKVAEGRLVSSTSVIWAEVAKRLASDWSLAQELEPYQWEEMIAGAFKNYGYDEVVITPRSGDHGRDIIATRRGIGCVKVIGSVKAYKPGHLVSYDDIRALVG